ncbi:TetR/AcrR family transcriptional regulator [Actinomyces capricornis]|uniref:TetR family transcriptional regulator n=1 Tax=Actinomyces capricornis TaxID=2755559 RepID=A0ABM7U9M0_9ACTO|nr:TetR family transcriptional regulator [Actinomyces capricornis]BDA64102.1 TetR family transcriptional regulator [Actinomyces capricornis]
MRSVPSSRDPDLTTAARIRHAAIACFAREGFGVGLRVIAAQAGVTAGLITHHFGSKQGLRRACDAEVLRITIEAKKDSVYFGGPTDLLAQMAQIEDYLPATSYALRSIQEGGELATQLMDSFVAETIDYTNQAVRAGTMTPSRDGAARARYLLYSGFGAMLLFARYEASDPADIEVVTREFVERYGPVTAELHSQPLFTDPALLEDYLRAAPATGALAAQGEPRARATGPTIGPAPATGRAAHAESPQEES